MPRKFRKKAGLGIVSFPGLPGLGNDGIVVGDEYARYCPAVLDEVFDDASDVPGASFSPSDVGDDVFRSEGDDKGVYRIEGLLSVPEPVPEPVIEFVNDAAESEFYEALSGNSEEVTSSEVTSESDVYVDVDVEPPNKSWTKKELSEYAVALGLSVKGLTKAQILGAIRNEESG